MKNEVRFERESTPISDDKQNRTENGNSEFFSLAEEVRSRIFPSAEQVYKPKV